MHVFVCHVIDVGSLPDSVKYGLHCRIADSAGVVSSEGGDGRTNHQELH